MPTNVPVTVWQPTDGLSDFSSSGGTFNIDDPSAVFLVDPSGIFIVDTGVTQTIIPGTVWSENDG